MTQHQRSLTTLLVCWLILTFGCKPDSALDSPLSPVPFPNCSYQYTTAAIDTFEYPPPYNSPTQDTPEKRYYEGHEVVDLCFSPHNPNLLLVAIQTDSLPGSTGLSGHGSMLIKLDICSGIRDVIYSANSRIYSVDWGLNDTIVLAVSGHPLESVKLLSPTGVFHGNLRRHGNPMPKVIWAPECESILFSGGGQSLEMNLSEEIINETEGIFPRDLVLISDSSFGYAQLDEIGVLNRQLEQASIVQTNYIYGNHYCRVGYSPENNSLIWVLDTILGSTNLNTWQSLTLKKGRSRGLVYFDNVSCSINGYIAYVTHVISSSLSSAGVHMMRSEIRLINPDGSDERRLMFDIE